MVVTVNKAQYRALNALRGLPQGAHMLLMCSTMTPTGGTLDGSEQDFEELVEFVGEELANGTLSASASRALYALCVKIDPDCAEWLGM